MEEQSTRESLNFKNGAKRRNALNRLFSLSSALLMSITSFAFPKSRHVQNATIYPNRNFGLKADIKEELKKIKEQLETITTVIDLSSQNLGVNGGIYQKLDDGEKEIEEIKKMLDDCSNSLGKSDDIIAIKDSLNAIKQLLSP